MAARFVCWLALGLHERSHSLDEELGNGPGCVPYVDACDLSVTRIPGDRGDPGVAERSFRRTSGDITSG
jgi:hypothetical protein